MSRLLPLALVGSLALLAPVAQARTVTLTEADSGKSVTLGRGDTLTVDLPVNSTAGYTWYAVYDPNGPLRLVGKQGMTVGTGMGIASDGLPEMSTSTWDFFSFKAADSAGFARHGFLNLLRMRNQPGVGGGYLWHISYTIKAAK